MDEVEPEKDGVLLGLDQDVGQVGSGRVGSPYLSQCC